MMTTYPLFETVEMPEAVAREYEARADGASSVALPVSPDLSLRKAKFEAMPDKHRAVLTVLRGVARPLSPLDIQRALLRDFGMGDSNVSRTVSEMREYMGYGRAENSWGWTENVYIGMNETTKTKIYGWILHEGGK